MYKIEIHNRINQIIANYYRLKIWQSEETSILNVMAKVFYFTIHFSYVVAVFLGLFVCDDDEFIFLIATFMAYSVINVKLYYLLRQQQDICSFLYDICSHSISDQIEWIRINDRINIFIKFVTYFLILAASGTLPFFCFRLPLFSAEKKLPLTIGFPLNWRNNEFSYWAAYFFVTMNHVLTVAFLSSTVIIWYIMVNCSIKYESLGSKFRRFGTNIAIEEEMISEAEKKQLFLREFIDLIRKYQELKK